MINKSMIWTVMLISIVVIAVHNIAIHPWMLDDAFISFRYAENFSLEQGLVYNLGEKVEGYTSFLWVVLLALGNRVGFDIIFFSKLLGVMFSIGCILLLINAHRFIKDIDKKTSVIATLFLGTCGIFTPWATSGMEVTMFTFLTLLSILLYISTKQILDNERQLCLVGVICAVSAMTRPEGILVFAVIFIDQLIASIKNRNKTVLYLATSFFVIYVPYFLWRFLYYGYLLPNTFYGKVGFTIQQVIRGVTYSKQFAVPALPFLIPAIISIFSFRLSRRFNISFLLPLIVAVYILYIVLVGGDCMPAFRFFTPIMPILCLISAKAITSLIKAKKVALSIVMVVVLYNLVQMRTNEEIYYHIRKDNVALHGREVGLWLKANAPADAVIATNAAGSIPYFSKLKTIDMLGMNDVHIAHRKTPSLGKGYAGHEKGDGSYVLSKSPDYILFGSSLGSLWPAFPSDHEIAKSPTFYRQYSLLTVPLESGKRFFIYEKKQNKN